MHYIYIVRDPRSNRVYIGETNNVERRVREHKSKAIQGLSGKSKWIKDMVSSGIDVQGEVLATIDRKDMRYMELFFTMLYKLQGYDVINDTQIPLQWYTRHHDKHEAMRTKYNLPDIKALMPKV